METNEPRVPEVQSSAQDVKFMEEVVAALRSATDGLTEDAILAVLAIRQYREIVSALEDLILMGEIDAERRAGVSDDVPTTVRDFVFFRVSDEDKALRRKTRKMGLDGDQLAF